MMDRELLRLYFICGSEDAKGEPLETIREALEGGVTIFQLREKGTHPLEGEALIRFASDIKAICKEHDVPFIVNDDWKLAEAVDADGIHLGQDDMAVSDLPEYFDDKIIGLSVRDAAELEVSSLEKVDYVGTGPVFTTPSKADAGAAIGIEGLVEMRRLIGDTPMVAIGGINETNYKACLDSGADGISLISAIAWAEDVKGAASGFLDG
ncbi:thiamine phosphate synthase [Salinicoccus bachuensis]|uniref:Thiamine-phosphate synthase n=1 Tax=Salinicoccus bachuensis TaxID=3136731 RepID=A0ABZ3CLN6_9STAP